MQLLELLCQSLSILIHIAANHKDVDTPYFTIIAQNSSLISQLAIISYSDNGYNGHSSTV